MPESDREDMEIFLEKIHQLLPVLGSDTLTPIGAVVHGGSANGLLAWKTQDGRTLKDLEAGVRESLGS